MAHDRPNACLTFGIEGALERLRTLLDQAIEVMPSCTAPERVIAWVEGFGARLYHPNQPNHPSHQANGSANEASLAPVAALRA
jgi:geranylgeranyl diphosphate synthase type II